MMTLNARILVNNNDMDEAIELLDDNGFDYDFDAGDRIMVAAEDLEAIEDLLDETGIDYEIIDY